jgi:hypothetical protein
VGLFTKKPAKATQINMASSLRESLPRKGEGEMVFTVTFE